MKKTKRIQSEAIEKIYWLRTEGKTYKAIAKEMGLRCSQVDCTLRTVNSYLDPTRTHSKKNKRRSYLRATQNIEAEIKVRGENAHSAVERFAQAVENPKVYGNEEGMHKLNIKDEEREGRVVVDRFDKLERSLSDFQQSISQFIEEEVRNQVGKVERENVELRSEVKRLCSELEPLKEEAHRSNWIGSLRKHFGTDKVTAL